MLDERFKCFASLLSSFDIEPDLGLPSAFFFWRLRSALVEFFFIFAAEIVLLRAIILPPLLAGEEFSAADSVFEYNEPAAVAALLAFSLFPQVTDLCICVVCRGIVSVRMPGWRRCFYYRQRATGAALADGGRWPR